MTDEWWRTPRWAMEHQGLIKLAAWVLPFAGWFVWWLASSARQRLRRRAIARELEAMRRREAWPPSARFHATAPPTWLVLLLIVVLLGGAGACDLGHTALRAWIVKWVFDN